MNYKRMGIAFVAVVVAALAYEFVVYGVLLKDLHRPHYGSLLRFESEVNQAGMLVWALVGAAVATYFFASYVSGRKSGFVPGLIFGACLGVMAAVVPQAYNGLLFKDWPFFPHWALAGFGENLLVGIVLGLLYRES